MNFCMIKKYGAFVYTSLRRKIIIITYSKSLFTDNEKPKCQPVKFWRIKQTKIQKSLHSYGSYVNIQNILINNLVYLKFPIWTRFKKNNIANKCNVHYF